jgi:uncharacterized SAM-binding protein YcdF (DUF218 family)
MDPSQPAADDRYHRRRLFRQLRAVLLAVSSGGLLLLASLRVVHAVARAASTRAGGATAIVVPGCRLRHGEVEARFARRLDRALAAWTDDPHRVLLLSGGTTTAGPSEAHGGLVHLADRGLPAGARVLLETAARDSEENLLLAARLLIARGVPIDAVVVVSNRWHLARLAWIAQRSGLPWRVCAAESRWRPGPAAWLAMLREALSLLSFAGYDAARIDPRHLLKPHR